MQPPLVPLDIATVYRIGCHGLTIRTYVPHPRRTEGRKVEEDRDVLRQVVPKDWATTED